MKIHQEYLDNYKGVLNHLTQEEFEEDLKDFINCELAVKDDNHFNEIYNAFLTQIELY